MAKVSPELMAKLNAQGAAMPEVPEVPTITLSADQQAAFDAAVAGENLFITGPGGTGKTEVVNRIITGLRSSGKTVAVTASTGIAAIRLSGCTIHSWLGTGILKNPGELKKALADHELYNAKKIEQRMKDADVLVVDEVSMLSGDFLSMMDSWIKSCRKVSLKRFGGLQVIFTGDFLQLPPVEKRGDRFEYRYAFESPAWKALKPAPIALRHVFRQDDEEFIGYLSKLRKGQVDEKMLTYFNARVDAKLEDPTRLYARNDRVYSVNYAYLQQLPGEKREYEADIDSEDDRWAEKIVKDCIADYIVELKVNAPVLFLRNNREAGYINGERGTVVEMADGKVTVRKETGHVVEARPETWELRDADQKVRATLTQIPLKLAWAMTIHKSQGMTLSRMECDVAECFAPGQTYVALSRAKSIDGLALSEEMESGHVEADPTLVAYCTELGI